MYITDCTRDQIRVVGVSDANKTEGRLEICNNELWGTVCSERIDRTTAMVACRELGYNTPGVQLIIGLQTLCCMITNN